MCKYIHHTHVSHTQNTSFISAERNIKQIYKKVYDIHANTMKQIKIYRSVRKQ